MEETKKSTKKEIMEWIIDIVAAVLIALLILQFIKPTVVREHSMENTLIENDYLFMSRKAYKWFGEPQRGDIIVFHSSLTTAEGKEKLLVKRIIAIPGDTIEIHQGMVALNGEILLEGYTKEGFTNGDMDEIIIPEGYLFCMGDNRQNSADSRDSRIGLVAIDDVAGKVVFRLFPFNKIGKVK